MYKITDVVFIIILCRTTGCPNKKENNFKVQMKCFFIAEFERTAKIRKITIYRFLISLYE